MSFWNQLAYHHPGEGSVPSAYLVHRVAASTTYLFGLASQAPLSRFLLFLLLTRFIRLPSQYPQITPRLSETSWLTSISVLRAATHPLTKCIVLPGGFRSGLILGFCLFSILIIYLFFCISDIFLLFWLYSFLYCGYSCRL